LPEISALPDERGAPVTFFRTPGDKTGLRPLFFIVKTHYLRETIVADERLPDSFERKNRICAVAEARNLG